MRGSASSKSAFPATARASRAGCEVCITKNYPVTVNDAELTEAMLPTLERVAGAAAECRHHGSPAYRFAAVAFASSQSTAA